MSKWSNKSRGALLGQMEMYIGAGISPDRAITFISENFPKKRRADLALTRTDLLSGVPLHICLGKHIGLAPSFTSVIKAGETSGSLGSSLRKVSVLMELQSELATRCFSSMLYPGLIALVTLVLTIGLVTGIMPQIIPLLKSLKGELPLLTKIVISVSRTTADYGLIGASCVTAIAASVIMGSKYSSKFRSIVHGVLLRIPIAGSLVNEYVLLMFFQSLGMMIESGIPSTLAYKELVRSVPILPIRSCLDQQIEKFNRGEKFSTISIPKLPMIFRAMIGAGEMSGQLGRSFTKVSEIMIRNLETRLKQLTSIIEPVMMIFMGAIIGSVALSIMMPIYDISRTLQK